MGTEWIVHPHGDIVEHTPALWTVEGSLPRISLRRRMSVLRLEDGRLIILNAVCVGAELLARIEGWGEPAFLVVPNRFHRADAPRWKARFPQIRVFCPGAARVKVEQVVAVDGDLGDLPPDPRVSFETLDGTRGDEPVFIVRGNGDEPARTLIFTDALFNHSHAQGFGGAIMRWMGSTGGPKVTPLFRMAGISDKEAFFEHLARLAGVEGPTRILVAHGDPITADAPGVLTRAAGA